MEWPDWWAWELELTPHLERRMEDRDFTEVDLRQMLETASGYRADIAAGRFVLSTRQKNRRWSVIVEPDAEGKVLIVVTAYPIDP